MEITRTNLDTLHPTAGYSHVTVVEAPRMAFLSGQVPLDSTGSVVGVGDVEAQVDQVVANAMVTPEAVCAEPAHVVRSVVYVASDDTATLSAVWFRFTGSPLGAAFTTASTLLGVARLGYEGQLVELELTAALPDR